MQRSFSKKFIKPEREEKKDSLICKKNTLKKSRQDEVSKKRKKKERSKKSSGPRETQECKRGIKGKKDYKDACERS